MLLGADGAEFRVQKGHSHPTGQYMVACAFY